ncbi:unnamed protein product, partial [Gordionus sp. m RMFG-2023]
IVMSIFGFYKAKQKQINLMNTLSQILNVTFLVPHNQSKKKEIEWNTEAREIRLDSKIHLSTLSYIGPCIMGIGCILIVVIYVITFEARDRAAKVFPAFLTKARTKAIYDSLIEDTKNAVEINRIKKKPTQHPPESNYSENHIMPTCSYLIKHFNITSIVSSLSHEIKEARGISDTRPSIDYIDDVESITSSSTNLKNQSNDSSNDFLGTCNMPSTSYILNILNF